MVPAQRWVFVGRPPDRPCSEGAVRGEFCQISWCSAKSPNYTAGGSGFFAPIESAAGRLGVRTCDPENSGDSSPPFGRRRGLVAKIPPGRPKFSEIATYLGGGGRFASLESSTEKPARHPWAYRRSKCTSRFPPFGMPLNTAVIPTPAQPLRGRGQGVRVQLVKI